MLIGASSCRSLDAKDWADDQMGLGVPRLPLNHATLLHALLRQSLSQKRQKNVYIYIYSVPVKAHMEAAPRICATTTRPGPQTSEAAAEIGNRRTEPVVGRLDIGLGGGPWTATNLPRKLPI